MEVGIRATGTLRINCRGIPDAVVQLKTFLEQKSSHRGSGYYYRPNNLPIVYVCWKDVRVVKVISTAYPGHSEHSVL